jgi:long-subunit fatty acid transport protein
MGRVLTTVSIFALGATSAFAGGIERSSQSVGALFKPGEYLEFSFGGFSPSVSGVFGGAVPSGDMAPSYTTYSFTYKRPLNDQVDLAIILDQPVGANVAYPASAAPYPFFGAKATIESTAVTGLLKYRFPSNFSVYGGLRIESVDASLSLPSGGGPYALAVDRQTDLGYVVGAAYERPDIALRVALTYNSAITHTFKDNSSTPFDVEIPESVNLEFQSGVAKDTLVFGSIKWREWTSFNISPPEYPANPLADGKSDVVTYSLGVGRRFNDKWSGAVILGYEKDDGLAVGNLAPTNGYKSIAIAATYKVDNIEITGALSYYDIGDATTTSIGAQFKGNTGIGAGIRVGYSF